jgi:hypothetical protein
MLQRLKVIITPQNFYVFALFLLAVAVPTSNYLMSMSQMMLLTAWMWHGNYRAKFRILFKSKAAIVAISLFLLHITGLLYTSDFTYAVKDLRTKLPLIILPFIICTMPPLNRRLFGLLVWIFSGAILLASFYSLHIFYSRDILDTRQISVFISHIRFSLCIVLAVYLLFFQVLYELKDIRVRIAGFILILWFIAFLIFLGALTGIVALSITAIVLLSIRLLKKTNPAYRIAIPIILTGLLIASTLYIRGLAINYVTAKPVDFSNLDKFSSHGNLYLHDTCIYGKENGMYVGLYFCPVELPKAWSERSKIDYFGQDENGQNLQATLVRYLNSKGYRKDAEGVQKLTDEEIKLIEKGVANINYLSPNPIKKALLQFLFGYEQYVEAQDPRGSSVMQRIELWKASVNIISDNFWFGVGTGDIPDIFKYELNKMDSKLENSSLRSHNQFLSITVGFGIFGLIFFLFSLIYPPVKEHKFRDLNYVVFFTIFMLSLLNEDTIESQAGVTFFAFFNALLIFGVLPENKETL